MTEGGEEITGTEVGRLGMPVTEERAVTTGVIVEGPGAVEEEGRGEVGEEGPRAVGEEGPRAVGEEGPGAV